MLLTHRFLIGLIATWPQLSPKGFNTPKPEVSVLGLLIPLPWALSLHAQAKPGSAAGPLDIYTPGSGVLLLGFNILMSLSYKRLIRDSSERNFENVLCRKWKCSYRKVLRAEICQCRSLTGCVLDDIYKRRKETGCWILSWIILQGFFPPSGTDDVMAKFACLLAPLYNNIEKCIYILSFVILCLAWSLSVQNNSNYVCTFRYLNKCYEHYGIQPI